MESHKNIKKRSRSENWLEEDKNLLIDLVREHVFIIENKTTDTTTNHEKSSAWEDVLESFNCMCIGGRRTVKQIKNQWCTIKMAKKINLSEEGKKLFQAGGRPRTSIIPENVRKASTAENIASIETVSNVRKASTAESISSIETVSKKDLLEVQLANEERKARNLDLQESLLKVKLDFFRKRMQLLEKT